MSLKSISITRADPNVIVSSLNHFISILITLLERASQLDLLDQMALLPRMLMQPPMHLDKARASHSFPLKWLRSSCDTYCTRFRKVVSLRLFLNSKEEDD